MSGPAAVDGVEPVCCWKPCRFFGRDSLIIAGFGGVEKLGADSFGLETIIVRSSE